MKILFITSNRIGDAVLSTAVLGCLIDRYPRAEVTVACGPAPAPLFNAVPGLQRVLVMEKKPRSGHWFELWRQCVLNRWGIVADLRSSAIGWTLWAGKRMILQKAPLDQHRVEHLSAFVENEFPSLVKDESAQTPGPRIWVDSRHLVEAERLIPAQGVGGAVLGIGPTANWGGKQWPISRFVELVERLTSAGGILPGARIAVFGAGTERAMAARLLSAIPPDRCVDLVGGVDLLTAAACLTRCALYIGNDSGLMHLAAASRVPTLGLFGPSREENYAPWGKLTASVRGEQSYEQIITAPGYDYTSSETRMGSLSVDKVEAAAKALWEECLIVQESDVA